MNILLGLHGATLLCFNFGLVINLGFSVSAFLLGYPTPLQPYFLSTLLVCSRLMHAHWSALLNPSLHRLVK